MQRTFKNRHIWSHCFVNENEIAANSNSLRAASKEIFRTAFKGWKLVGTRDPFWPFSAFPAKKIFSRFCHFSHLLLRVRSSHVHHLVLKIIHRVLHVTKLYHKLLEGYMPRLSAPSCHLLWKINFHPSMSYQGILVSGVLFLN